MKNFSARQQKLRDQKCLRPGLLHLASLLLVGLCLNGCITTDMTAYNEAVIKSIVDKNQNLVATGYAVISVQKADTPAQQRLLSIRASKLDAYRSLMEQVYGQYLDVNTTVAEMVIQSDTFRSRVQGVVYGAKLVSITPVGDDTYETTLSLSNDIVNDLRKLYLAAMAGSGVSSMGV